MRDFSKAMREFFNLIKGFHNDVAKESSIEWYIESLEGGSAIATVKGIGEKDEDVHLATAQRIKAKYFHTYDITKLGKFADLTGLNIEEPKSNRFTFSSKPDD